VYCQIAFIAKSNFLGGKDCLLINTGKTNKQDSNWHQAQIKEVLSQKDILSINFEAK
jgi:hypothetical protein